MHVPLSLGWNERVKRGADAHQLPGAPSRISAHAQHPHPPIIPLSQAVTFQNQPFLPDFLPPAITGLGGGRSAWALIQAGRPATGSLREPG